MVAKLVTFRRAIERHHTLNASIQTTIRYSLGDEYTRYDFNAFIIQLLGDGSQISEYVG